MSENENESGDDDSRHSDPLSAEETRRIKRKAKLCRMQKYKSMRAYEFLISLHNHKEQAFYFHLCYPIMRQVEADLYIEGRRR